jgi:hypothetical protein
VITDRIEINPAVMLIILSAGRLPAEPPMTMIQTAPGSNIVFIGILFVSLASMAPATAMSCWSLIRPAETLK